MPTYFSNGMSLLLQIYNLSNKLPNYEPTINKFLTFKYYPYICRMNKERLEIKLSKGLKNKIQKEANKLNLGVSAYIRMVLSKQ